MAPVNNMENVIAQHEASGYYTTVEGVKTFYLDKGSGEVVFCIHGVPTSSFLYRKLVPALAQLGLRGVAVDLPGLGLSDRPTDYNYLFSNFAVFCQQLLDALQVKSYHLVLHDIGTPIGLALAAHNSSRVKSITVLNSMLDIEHFVKPLPMRPFEKPILGEAELALITRTTWPGMMAYAGLQHINSVPNEEIAAYVDLLKLKDEGKAFLKIMRHFEQTKSFSQTCYNGFTNPAYPVQLIWGMNDPFLPYTEHGVAFTQARPATLVHQVQAKHFLQEEQYNFIAEKVHELAVRANA